MQGRNSYLLEKLNRREKLSEKPAIFVRTLALVRVEWMRKAGHRGWKTDPSQHSGNFLEHLQLQGIAAQYKS